MQVYNNTSKHIHYYIPGTCKSIHQNVTKLSFDIQYTKKVTIFATI